MDVIDLHTHSKASDGSLQPAELVRHAKNKGLKAIALTDHDTIKGLDEAVAEGKMIGVEVLPGIEISADYSPEMHILGYFVNGDYSRIAGVLADLREKREERNPKIIRKLNEMGFDISMDEVLKNSGGGVTGRPHIAKVLYEKGYVESMKDAFDRFLSHGRPAYFKKEKLTPEQCINDITSAGGIPVLAHPIYLNKNLEELDLLLDTLKKAGLMGMEAYYVDNSPEQTEMMLSLAEKHKLIVTGGSDFHGSYKPDIEIGVGRGNLEVPYELLEQLKNIGAAINHAETKKGLSIGQVE